VGTHAGRRGRGAAVGLALVAFASAVLYWAFWLPVYRLNERFEYADLLFTAFPAIATAVATQLGLARLVLGTVSYEAMALLVGGLFLALFGLYLLALVTIDRTPRRAAVATVLGATLAFQVVVLPLPGVFTTDLFSYAMYGEIAGRFGDSPYVEAPDQYPTHPLYLMINPLWRDAPSVYGPLWIGLSSAVGAALGGQVLAEVLAYRLLADLSHWVNLGLLWWALHRLRPGGEALGLALYAFNPLVVFEFAANGHNDGTMLLFVLLCFGWLARGRVWLGVAALVLSMATKYTTVIVLPLVLWWAVRTQPSWWRRLALAGAAGLAGLAAIAAAYLPWWRGPATLGPLIYWVSTPLYANYAPIGIAGWVRDRLVDGGWGWDEAEGFAYTAQRLLVRIAYLGYLAVEMLRFTPRPDGASPAVPRVGGAPAAAARRAWTATAPGRPLRRALRAAEARLAGLYGRGRTVDDLALAGARALLLFLLVVNTWVLPWYFTWPVALVALGDPRSRTTAVVLGFSLSAPLSMYWAQTHFEGLQPMGYAVYLAPLGALAAWTGWRWLGGWRRAAGAAPQGDGARMLSNGGR
jgi:hypothetical protein